MTDKCIWAWVEKWDHLSTPREGWTICPNFQDGECIVTDPGNPFSKTLKHKKGCQHFVSAINKALEIELDLWKVNPRDISDGNPRDYFTHTAISQIALENNGWSFSIQWTEWLKDTVRWLLEQ